MAKVVHFEIPMDDPDRAAAFYQSALGWQINRFGGEDYWLAQAGPDEDVGANGALVRRGDVHRTPVLVIGVGDLDATLEQVTAAGGTVIAPKGPVPGVGWAAYAKDTEGNTIGLFQPDESAG